MASDAIAYTKTLEDELDWNLLGQLHHVVSQISGFCYETKKFCVTTEFVVLTLLVKFTGDKLDHSVFVTGLVIAVCFWFLDAVAFYYQVKLRGAMDAIRERLRSRQSKQLVGVTTPSQPTIDPSRTNRALPRRVFDAACNHSMWIYGFLIGIDIGVWMAFAIGSIG